MVALTIAGHDPSSGAGVTADLQTFAAHGLFGTSAITAITVQSTLEVARVQPVSPDFLRHTLDHLHADLPPSGVKIGMYGSAENAEVIALYLQALLRLTDGKQHIPCVLDPILRSSSGTDLTGAGSLLALDVLLPYVSWITPNWQELAALAGRSVDSLATAEAAAAHLGSLYPHLHIVATAGDSSTPTDLLRIPTGDIHYFTGEHIPTTSTHGTGCAFSSALLSRLLLGDDPVSAVRSAKTYVTEAIRRAPNLGQGRGPLNLLWTLTL